MPAETEIVEPSVREIVEERVLPDWEEQDAIDEGPYVVILYNDEYHGMDEVAAQLQKATGYAIDRCIQIMFEAHSRGRAIAYTGTSDSCERAANILRQIRLQVETDKF